MLHPAHKVRFASLPSGCTGPKSSPILSCLEGKVELLLCYLLVTLSSISKTELQKATLRQSLKMLFLSGFAIVDQKMTTERAIKACVYACVRACAVDKDVNQLQSRKLSFGLRHNVIACIFESWKVFKSRENILYSHYGLNFSVFSCQISYFKKFNWTTTFILKREGWYREDKIRIWTPTPLSNKSALSLANGFHESSRICEQNDFCIGTKRWNSKVIQMSSADSIRGRSLF